MSNLVDACMLKLKMNVAYMVKNLGFGDDFAISSSSCTFGSRWLSIQVAVGVNIIVCLCIVLMIPEFFLIWPRWWFHVRIPNLVAVLYSLLLRKPRLQIISRNSTPFRLNVYLAVVICHPSSKLLECFWRKCGVVSISEGIGGSGRCEYDCKGGLLSG